MLRSHILILFDVVRSRVYGASLIGFVAFLETNMKITREVCAELGGYDRYYVKDAYNDYHE